jgi:hypothetical protein
VQSNSLTASAFKCHRYSGRPFKDRDCKIILIIKTNEMHYFSNLFWYRTLHVSDRFTVYTAIGNCHTDVLKMGKITSVYTGKL